MSIEDLFPPQQQMSPERQERIRSVLRAEPSPAASARPWRPSRRWRVLAAPAAAAAAVTAIAILVTVMIPAGQPNGGPAARDPLTAPPTGRQILLAAAATVAHQHPSRYWHFSISSRYPGIPRSGGGPPLVQWVDREGTWWTNPECRLGLTEGAVMYMAGGTQDNLGNAELTYNRVRHWPTAAAGLKAKIASYDHSQSDQLQILADLEFEVPAPPGIRVAASRAIAALPGLQNRGTVKGGRTVYVPERDGGPLMLVINPRTGLIHSETARSAPADPMIIQTALAGQWASHLPNVIPRSKYYCTRGRWDSHH